MNLHVSIALEHSNLRVRPISADTPVVKGLINELNVKLLGPV